MTREEAIQILEDGEWWENFNPWYETANAEYLKLHDAVDIALSELRAQKEVEKNDPLTLEDLWEMSQRCEGVYVAHTNGTPVFREQAYCAAALDFSPSFGSTKMHVHAIYGDRLTFWEDEYGKTWLAYRHKPKEEMT